MTRFQVEFKTVLNDYPEIVEEFLDNLRTSNSPFKDTEEEDIRWYYTWEFEYDDPSYDSDLEMSRFDLKYEERFRYELEKVKVNVTMKAGQFKRRDRVTSSVIPKDIIKIVDEVVKIMMTEEQKFFANDEVTKSIPPLDDSMYSDSDQNEFNTYNSYTSAYTQDEIIYEEELEEDIEYDLDDVLDKISEQGIDSLTESEKEFLDELSKS